MTPPAATHAVGWPGPKESWLSLAAMLLVLPASACDSVFEPSPPAVESMEAIVGGFAETDMWGVYTRSEARGEVRWISDMPGRLSGPGRVAHRGSHLMSWALRSDDPDSLELVTVDLSALEIVETQAGSDIQLSAGDAGAMRSLAALTWAGENTWLASHWADRIDLPAPPRYAVRGVAVVDARTLEVVSVIEPVLTAEGGILVAPPSAMHPDGLWVLAGTERREWGADSELFLVDPRTAEVTDRIVVEEDPAASNGTFVRVLLDEERQEVVALTLGGLYRVSLVDGSITPLPRPPGPGLIAMAPDDGEVFFVARTDFRTHPGEGLVFRYRPEVGGGYELFQDLRGSVEIVDRSPAHAPVLTDIAVSGDGSRVFVVAGGHRDGPLFPVHPAVLLVLDRKTGELLAEHELGAWGFPWVMAL